MRPRFSVSELSYLNSTRPFPCYISLFLLWNGLMAPDRGTDELSALSAQDALILLIKTFCLHTQHPYMWNITKFTDVHRLQLLIKSFDTYP